MYNQPCKYFRLGTCHRGNKCWYMHDKGVGSMRASSSTHYSPSSSSYSSSSHNSRGSPSTTSHRGSPSNSFSRSSNTARGAGASASYRSSNRSSPIRSDSRNASSRSDRSSSTVLASSDSNTSRYPSSNSNRVVAGTSLSSSRGHSTNTSSSSRHTPVTSFNSSRDPRTSGYNSHRPSSSSPTTSNSISKSSTEPTRSSSSAAVSMNGSKPSPASAKLAIETLATLKKKEEAPVAVVSVADTKPEDPSLQWGGGAWGEAFLEGVAKCEGTSGKKLYLYGVSSTRCPSCRNRVKLENDVCESCEYKHQRAKTCKMCALIKPSMWCYECDASFCEACHLKPHVLVLGGGAPARHNCFAIEGASGRLHGKSAWSLDFAATVKNVFRLRVGEKIAQGEAVSVSIDMQPVAAAAKLAPTPAAAANAPATTIEFVQALAAVSMPQPPQQPTKKPVNGSAGSESEPMVVSDSKTPVAATSAAVPGNSAPRHKGENGSAPAPAPNAPQPGRAASSGWLAQNAAARPESTTGSSTAAASIDDTGSPSRKRKLSETEATARIPPTSAAQPSLFDKVRLMHEQKARQAHQQQQAALLRHQQQKQQMIEQQQQQRLLQERQIFREQQQAQQQMNQQLVQQQERLTQQFVQQQERIVQQQELIQQQQQDRHSASQTGGLPVASQVPSPVASTVAMSAEDQVVQTGIATAASMPSLAPTAASAAAHQPPSPSVSAPSPQHFQQVPSPHQYQQQQQQHMQQQLQQQLQLQQQQQELQQQQLVVAQPSLNLGNSFQFGGAASFAMPSPSNGAMTSAPAAIPIVDLSTDNSTLSATSRSNNNYPDASSNMDDPLKFAIVQEYDQINTYALHLEASKAKLNEHVRQISMQNVTTAAKLNEQIKVYRTKLDQVYERRFEALAKVIMFSPDVRSRVKKIDQSTLGDIPHVLTACNSKCAQLAANIKTCESHVQQLRNAIDLAITSGDPEKLGQLHLLGKQISSHEQKIQSQRTERDDQFVLMIQYSRKLREVVRQQAMQNAKAKAPRH